MAEEPDAPSDDACADLDELLIFGSPQTRRRFIRRMAETGAAITIGPGFLAASSHAAEQPASASAAAPNRNSIKVNLKINGKDYAVDVDPRTTLLDALRERLQLTGSKKGCDHGQCGACTVHVDGRRVLSCLTLAATLGGKHVTTIEGLAGSASDLHPMQRAFIEHDGFQCG